MSENALQQEADKRVSDGMNEYLGSGHGFRSQPVRFDTTMHIIQARWRWFLEVDIKRRTVAGNFNNTSADWYFKSADDAREAAEKTARQVRDGEHGFGGKLSAAIAERPVAGFGTSAFDLGGVSGTYNHHFNCAPCGGHGNVTCARCDGVGTTQCTSCWGSSRLNCSYCSGSGSITRDENTSHGWVSRVRQCGHCFGQGKLHCYTCNLGQIGCNRCGRSGTESCQSCGGHGYFTQRSWMTVKCVRRWLIHYPKNIANWGKVFLDSCLNRGDGPAQILQTAAFEKVQIDPEYTHHAQLAFTMNGKLPLIEYRLRNGGNECTVRMVGFRANVEHWGHLADFTAQQLSEPFIRNPASLQAAKHALAIPVNDLVLYSRFGGNKSVPEEHRGIISSHYQSSLVQAILQLIDALTWLRKTAFRRSVAPLALIAFLVLMGGGILVNAVFPGLDWSGSGIGMLTADWRGVLETTAQETINIPLSLFNQHEPFARRLIPVGGFYGSALLLTMTFSPLGVFRRGNLLLALIMLPAMVLLLILLRPVVVQMSNITPNLQLTSLGSSAWAEAAIQAARQLFGSLAIASLIGLALARRRARRLVRRATANVGNRNLEALIND